MTLQSRTRICILYPHFYASPVGGLKVDSGAASTGRIGL